MADFATGKLFEDPTLMLPNGKVWPDITPKCEIFPIKPKDAFTEANKVAMISLKSK